MKQKTCYFWILPSFQGNLKMRPMVLPDTFIEAGTQTEQYEEAGLSAGHIRASVLRLFDQTPVPTLSASKASNQ